MPASPLFPHSTLTLATATSISIGAFAIAIVTMVVHSLIFDEASGRSSAVSKLNQSLMGVGAATHCTNLQWQCSVFRGNCRRLATKGTLREGTRKLCGAAALEELDRQHDAIGQTVGSLFNHDQMKESGRWEALEQSLKGIDCLLGITQESAAANPSWVKATALSALHNKVVVGIARNSDFENRNELVIKHGVFKANARTCKGQPIRLGTYTSTEGTGFTPLKDEEIITFLAGSRDTLLEELNHIQMDPSNRERFQQLCNDIQTAADIAVTATENQYAQSEINDESGTIPGVVYADYQSKNAHGVLSRAWRH